jgi:hypothetical protein
LKSARFDTGNGITLCNDCHREAHAGLNGLADLSLPMDAQGGEKIEIMERLYSILAADATERGILRDDFYFVSDDVLGRFKMFQGFGYFTPFPGFRLEQAFLIWAQMPQNLRRALLLAVGVEMANEPKLPENALVVFD